MRCGTDGIVCISRRDGEVGSIKTFGYFNLRHISGCILKCVILLLCVSCVKISLVCSVQWC